MKRAQPHRALLPFPNGPAFSGSAHTRGPGRSRAACRREDTARLHRLAQPGPLRPAELAEARRDHICTPQHQRPGQVCRDLA